MNTTILNNIDNNIENLRKTSPLTLCITNFVTVNDCANSVLAIGGSPIMIKAPEESEEIVNIASSVLVNTGTIDSQQAKVMKIASKTAFNQNKPFVLDPVGIGISNIRNQVPLDIIKDYTPTIIRANMSEIKALANLLDMTDEVAIAKGVDVADTDKITKDNYEENAQIIKNIASKLDTTIALSGQIDIISDSENTYAVENGDAMMSQITGSGCMLGCIMASYAAITTPIEAALTATLVESIAGEIAANKVKENNQATGFFRTYLIDQMGKMDKDTLFEYANITKL